jgi:MFS family permease
VKSFYTTQFWLLCISNFFFTASFQMLLPELPSFLAAMGGQKKIGLIIALFTLTAGLSRPFSGKITDSVGRVPVMVFGSLVCFFCGFLYPIVAGVNAFLLLRFFHGFSTGTKPTATAAYVADIVPENRRGEAAGMLGIFTAIGFSIGPAFGSFLTDNWGVNYLFYGSSVFALLSIIILGNLQETLPKANKKPLSWQMLKINIGDIFEKKVVVVFFVMLFICFSTGAVLTLVPDQTRLLGIKNKGLFYTIYTIAALTVRILFAKTSDKYGRIPVMKVTCFVMVAAMVLLAFANTVPLFILASVLFGFATGMAAPTLTAWTIDLSDVNYRGRALATMYIALEAGIGLGAYISGLIYQGNEDKLYISYLISAIFALFSFFSIYIFKPKLAQA